MRCHSQGGNMDTRKQSKENLIVELMPAPLRIKDLMLGELLCQAGILTDKQVLHYAELARCQASSLGSAFVFSGLLSSSELFVARRLVNRYINDSDNPEHYIKSLGTLIRNRPPKQPRKSLGLARITRKHMTMPKERFTVTRFAG